MVQHCPIEHVVTHVNARYMNDIIHLFPLEALNDTSTTQKAVQEDECLHFFCFPMCM